MELVLCENAEMRELLQADSRKRIFDYCATVEEARAKIAQKEYKFIYVVDSDTAKKRTDLMSMHSEACSIPMIFLCERPEQLSFVDSLGAYYRPDIARPDYFIELRTSDKIDGMLEGLRFFRNQELMMKTR